MPSKSPTYVLIGRVFGRGLHHGNTLAYLLFGGGVLSEEVVTGERNWRRRLEWKALPWSTMDRINMVKTAILPIASYKIRWLLRKYQHFFHKTRKEHYKFIWRHKRPRRAKAVLSKRSNAGSIILPNFKLYYEAVVAKHVVLVQKQTYRSMWQNKWHKNKPKHANRLAFFFKFIFY